MLCATRRSRALGQVMVILYSVCNAMQILDVKWSALEPEMQIGEWIDLMVELQLTEYRHQKGRKRVKIVHGLTQIHFHPMSPCPR